MPERTPENLYGFPLSGDVTQAFRWWTSLWSQWMGQFGFININLAKSSEPALERRIVENVAGYGRQLGRMIEALEALLAHTDRTSWTAAQKKAYEDFRELADAIAAEKGAWIAPTRENAERFLEGLRRLKETDVARYREIVDQVKTDLFP
jgi:hypothetical protein